MSKSGCGWWSYAKYMTRHWPNGLRKNERTAVAAAMAETERLKDGAARLKVVRLVLMEGSHTLEGAALAIPCSHHTAQRYHADFLYSVGRHFKCNGLR